jgi:hypothetical protein
MVPTITSYLKRCDPLYQVLRTAAIYGQGQLCRVPLGICTNPMGFSFAPTGWNYLVEQLKQFDRGGAATLEDTLLYEYHQRYQPQDMSDLPMAAGMQVHFKPGLSVYPWGSFRIEDSRRGGTVKDAHSSRFYGPSSAALVERDLANLRELYRSLKTDGYKPWRRGNSFIGGVFLERSDGQRKFVILQGNHRTAVLSYLGQQNMTVRYLKGHFRRIREDDMNDWYYVRSGLCSREDAKAYFHAFFRLDGRERARKMGLLEDVTADHG